MRKPENNVPATDDITRRRERADVHAGPSRRSVRNQLFVHAAHFLRRSWLAVGLGAMITPMVCVTVIHLKTGGHHTMYHVLYVQMCVQTDRDPRGLTKPPD